MAKKKPTDAEPLGKLPFAGQQAVPADAGATSTQPASGSEIGSQTPATEVASSLPNSNTSETNEETGEEGERTAGRHGAVEQKAGSAGVGICLQPRPIPGRKLYQDEIYGTKELSPLAVALIDTPEFQRLSHVYQLGFTYQVFRGANHRRFDHCVGTYFVVRTLMRRVVQNHARFYNKKRPDSFQHPGLSLSLRYYLEAPATPREGQSLNSPMGRWRGLMEVVSAGALLHDLGHVPVGHTLEDEFSVLGKHDSLGGSRLFEMLYGPRDVPTQSRQRGDQAPQVEDYFGPIKTEELAQPEQWGRVCLPWVFERGVYEPFFSADFQEESGVGPSRAMPLQNWEIRDLIYLILSFKENVRPEEYRDFSGELDVAERKADGPAAKRRIRFIRDLYTWYAGAIDLGDDRPALPLFHPFMSDLVGNTICADLLDYLVRDGKRLNLEIRNNARLHRYLVIKPQSSTVTPGREVLRLTINATYRSGLKRRDTVSDLLDLMGERYRFAEVVYYHPKKAAFSAMLAKAMELTPAAGSGNDDLYSACRPRDDDKLYPAPWSGYEREAAPPHITHFGDESLIAYLRQTAKSNGVEASIWPLLDGISYRNEYRLLFTVSYEAAQAAGGVGKFINYLRKDVDQGRKEIEAWLEQVVALRTTWKTGGGGPPAVLIYCPNQRMQAKEVAAHVELSPGKVVPLNFQQDDPTWNEIELLNEKYRRLWRLYVFVHPRLVGAAQQDVELFSTLIDCFCDRFQVAERFRSDGSRLGYINFPKRLSICFRQWRELEKSGPLPFDKIAQRIESPMLWKGVGSLEIPFPVTESDHAKGFMRAALSLAADEAMKNGAGKRPTELRFISGDRWWETAATKRVEAKRRDAVQKFDEFAPSVSQRIAARTEDRDSWESIVRKVDDMLASI